MAVSSSLQTLVAGDDMDFRWQDQDTVWDFIIVGSGFGGSVSALRLAEKGYRVLVIEKGRRWSPSDFPQSNRQISKFFWAPIAKCFGIQQISLLKGVMVLHGAGVGGGSLVYANTLMKPLDSVFDDASWPQPKEHSIHWKSELDPHYETAKKMLGVAVNKIPALSDELMRDLGRSLGCEDSFHYTEVGVCFSGKKGELLKDPYFNGDGPDRISCTGCGACMIGCRVGAKNTLDKNYLFLAEKKGVQVLANHRVGKISKDAGVFTMEVRDTRSYFSRSKKLMAKKVILAAGVMGTLEILFKNKFDYKTLSEVSERLGDHVRTNGESLCGVTSLDVKMNLSEGIAIGSAIHPDAVTKIEPVRYPSGSDVMRWLAVPLTDAAHPLLRPFKLMGNIVLQFPKMFQLLFVKDWARQSVILLVMQSIDQKMKIKWGRSYLTGFLKGLVGDENNEKVPSYLPIAQRATKNLAEQIDGVPQNIFSEVLLGIPATAHILGGCVMGSDASQGVINDKHEVFGVEGLYVCDGSVVPANLGVNPSLTITALAERFASQF